MSASDGRQARAIQGLAAALQECLDSAAESGARRVREEIRDKVRTDIRNVVRSEVRDVVRSEVRDVVRSEVRNEVANVVRDEVGPRLDRQDETLRLIWRQCGGDPDRRLPCDH